MCCDVLFDVFQAAEMPLSCSSIRIRTLEVLNLNLHSHCVDIGEDVGVEGNT